MFFKFYVCFFVFFIYTASSSLCYKNNSFFINGDKVIKKFIIGATLLQISVAATASAEPYIYTEEEGPWVVRGKAGISVIQSSESTELNGAPVASGDELFDNSAAFELEGSYFINDHFSFSGSLGYQPQEDLYISLNNGLTSNTTNGKFKLYPVSASVQFYPAPYGQIRPYVGVGAHYTFATSSFNALEIEDNGGALVQAGTDIWINEHWGINLDVKKIWFETKIDETKLWDKNNEKRERTVKVNPLVVTGGVAYRF